MRADDERHGRYAGAVQHYKDRTPLCDPCRQAHRTYGAMMKKRIALGNRKRVPAPLVRAHLDRLRALGMTIPSIAEQSGLAFSTVRNIAEGRRVQTTHATAAAIAKLVPAEQTPDRVPAWRVERRLQALHALGWTIVQIAQHAGWQDRNVNALMYPRWRQRESVSLATFQTFDEVYRDLCMKMPPRSAGSLVAVRRSAERCWPNPLAWDDIDDPAEVPRDWRYTEPTRLELVADMLEQGANVTEVCRRLGITRDALWTWCSNNGLRPTYAALVRRETSAA